MNDPDKHYNAILRLHDKMDSLVDSISDIRVDIAKLPIKVFALRLKILESVVYCAVALVLIAFMVTLTDSPKKVTASTTQTIMHKVVK